MFIRKLREAQRAWLAFREAELAARYPEQDKRLSYGSVYPMCRRQVLAELTGQQTAQLRQWLAGAEEGEVCAGSIKKKE